jgi:hypothetical protein
MKTKKIKTETQPPVESRPSVITKIAIAIFEKRQDYLAKHSIYNTVKPILWKNAPEEVKKMYREIAKTALILIGKIDERTSI